MPSSLDLAARLSGVVALQQEILNEITDLDPLLNTIVRRVPEITSGTGAVVELKEGDELVYRAASGIAAPHVGLRLPLRGSLSGQVITERTMMRCDDTEVDPRVDIVACRTIGIRSMIIAPLLHGNEAHGVLKTFASRPRAFDDLDAYAVQLLAGMTSSAVIRAREFRARRLSEERYRLLFEQNIAGVFRTTPEGEILDGNDALVRVLGYDSKEEFLKHQVWDLYQNRADREALLESLRASRAMTNVHVRLKRKDGSHLNGILNLSVIPSAEGEQVLGTLVAE